MREQCLRRHSIRPLAIFLTLAALAASLAAPAWADGTSKRLKIVNGCKDPIWINYLVGAGGGSLSATNKKKLVKNASISYDIPDIGLAGTRFWPSMGCDSNGNNCTIGQSGGPTSDGFACPAPIGCAPPVDSKFEGTFGCLPSVDSSKCQVNPSSTQNPKAKLPTYDGWDTSMVDGFTLPYKVTVDPPDNQSCSTGPSNNKIDCSGLKFSLCPTNEDLSTNNEFPDLKSVDLTLKYPNKNGTPSTNTAGCFSPCAKLTSGQWQSLPNPPFSGTTYAPSDDQADYYCCPDLSVSECRKGPVVNTKYVKMIHQYCADTYAYSYDDTEGNFKCPAGTSYTMTFYCPK